MPYSRQDVAERARAFRFWDGGPMTLPVTAPDYVKELHQELLVGGFDDLAESIAPIEQFVRKRWLDSHMGWFTDHGPHHSKTVAKLAMELASPPYVHKPLNAIERYALWAAAWLHDVGMQSLLGGRYGSITAAGYDDIRREHPNESLRIILDSIELIGLQPRDRPLHNAIAHVARAHGTEFYLDSVRYLEQELPKVRGHNFRGSLLAAILLMADELDLGYERALALTDIPEELNTISNAHALKHDCVLGVSIQHTNDGTITIKVHSTQAPAVPDRAMDMVERWIFDKLRSQIGRTELQLAAGFGGQVRFSRGIEFRRVQGQSPASPPEQATLDHIQAANAKSDLINHRDEFKHATRGLKEGYSLVLTGALVGREMVDRDGREDLLAAVAADALDWGATVIQSNCIRESLRASPMVDVLAELCSQLGGGLPARQGDGPSLVQQLERLIGAIDGDVIVGISSLDLLETAEALAMLDVLSRLDDGPGVRVVISCSDEGELLDRVTESKYLRVDCKRLNKDGVAESLSWCLPVSFSREEAAAENLPYSHYAGLRLRHLRHVG